MRRSTAKILAVVAAALAIILAIACIFIFDSKYAGYVVLAIYFPIGIWIDSQLRCPYCGAWPRKGHSFHQYCPKCGMPLDDE